MTKDDLLDIRAALDKASYWARKQADLFQIIDAKKKVETLLNKTDLPSNLDEAAAEWIAKQGISYQATISADKTIPVLPMKDVSDMGLDYGDKVCVIIVKEK